jgi:hypothetical protein
MTASALTMMTRLVRRESEKSAPETVETKVPFVSCTSRLYLSKGRDFGATPSSAAVANVLSGHFAACDTLSHYEWYSTLNFLGIAPGINLPCRGLKSRTIRYDVWLVPKNAPYRSTLTCRHRKGPPAVARCGGFELICGFESSAKGYIFRSVCLTFQRGRHL